MRPASIVMFERLFLASLVLSVINFIVGYDAAREELGRQPGMAQIGFASELLIGTMVFATSVYLLLWHLIARRASNVAKWFLTAFTVIGVASLAYRASIVGLAIDLNALLGMAYYALAVAAVVFLFKSDAVAWLGGEKSADPATVD